MRTHPTPDFGFADQAFALVAETALDGERITRERDQRRRDREEAARRQPSLFETNNNPTSTP